MCTLRMGHCALNKFLHRIAKKDSPECKSEHEEESVEHLERLRFQEHGEELQEAVKTAVGRVSDLL